MAGGVSFIFHSWEGKKSKHVRNVLESGWHFCQGFLQLDDTGSQHDPYLRITGVTMTFYQVIAFTCFKINVKTCIMTVYYYSDT